eukprot:GHVT01059078.1.p1 GENE.GHVT01059078.1~~GHVT01059078.1.p1  ORF type:complete len:996 (-),score=273.43 GHVT01059078.1:474-3077(-)
MQLFADLLRAEKKVVQRIPAGHRLLEAIQGGGLIHSVELALQLLRNFIGIVAGTLHCVDIFSPTVADVSALFMKYRRLLPSSLKQWLFDLCLTLTEDTVADGRLRVSVNRPRALRASEEWARLNSLGFSSSPGASEGGGAGRQGCWTLVSVPGEQELGTAAGWLTSGSSASARNATLLASVAAPAGTGAELRSRKAAEAAAMRNSVFGQIFCQLRHVDPRRLRASRRPWYVLYEGEGGVDAGGIFRDALTHVCQELQSNSTCLLLPTPNSRSADDGHLDSWLPNGALSSPTSLAMYFFLGQMMAVAVRGKHCLDLTLPPFFWRRLVKQTIRRKDVKNVDSAAIQRMDLLGAGPASVGGAEEDAGSGDSSVGLTSWGSSTAAASASSLQSASSSPSDQETIHKPKLTAAPPSRAPPCPAPGASCARPQPVVWSTTLDGRPVALQSLKAAALPRCSCNSVAASNSSSSSSSSCSSSKTPSACCARAASGSSSQAERLVMSYKRIELDVQIDAIRVGFSSIIPPRLLDVLTATQLERLVCGSNEIDIGRLRAHARYSGYAPSDPVVLWLWEVLEEFDEREKQSFLRFAWGRSRLPPVNTTWDQELEIVRRYVDSSSPHATGVNSDAFSRSIMAPTLMMEPHSQRSTRSDAYTPLLPAAQEQSSSQQHEAQAEAPAAGALLPGSEVGAATAAVASAHGNSARTERSRATEASSGPLGEPVPTSRSGSALGGFAAASAAARAASFSATPSSALAASDGPPSALGASWDGAGGRLTLSAAQHPAWYNPGSAAGISNALAQREGSRGGAPPPSPAATKRPEDNVLPSSHTCFFQVEFPVYSSKEILRQKLLYAITEGLAIDADNDAVNVDWDDL